MSEVAEQTGVGLSTVKRWVSTGRLVHTRVGGVVLIRPADLEAFLDARTVMTTEEWVEIQAAKVPPPTPEQLAEVRRLLTPTENSSTSGGDSHT